MADNADPTQYDPRAQSMEEIHFDWSEGVYLPVYSEYVEDSRSSRMLMCVCIWGKCTHFV